MSAGSLCHIRLCHPARPGSGDQAPHQTMLWLPVTPRMSRANGVAARYATLCGSGTRHAARNHQTPNPGWGIGGLNVAANSCIGRHSSFIYTDRNRSQFGLIQSWLPHTRNRAGPACTPRNPAHVCPRWPLIAYCGPQAHRRNFGPPPQHGFSRVVLPAMRAA